MLRRLTAITTLATTVFCAGLLEAPYVAAAPVKAPRSAAPSSANLPTSSLSVSLIAPPAVKPSKKSPITMPVSKFGASAFIVKLQPMAIIGSTKAKPAMTISLPRGVEFVNIHSDLDEGVTGTWKCHGKTSTVTCVLSGSIRNGRVAAASITVKGTSSLPAAGRSAGTISVTSVANVTDPQKKAQTVTGTASVAVTSVRTFMPAVFMRAVNAATHGNHNSTQIRATALTPMNAKKPGFRLSSLTPLGATDVSARGVGWKCGKGSRPACTTTSPLAVGVPRQVAVSFLAAGTSKTVSWDVQGTYARSVADGSRPVKNTITVRQPRAVPSPASFTARFISAQGQGLVSGRTLPVELAVTNKSFDSYAPRVALSLPAGVSMTIDPTSAKAAGAKGWTCTSGAAPVCTGPAIRGGKSVRIPVTLKAGVLLENGVGVIRGTITPGDNKKFAHPFHLIDAGDPVAGIRLRHPSIGGSRPWDNGRVLRTEIGIPSNFQAVLTNIGGDALRPGQTAVATQTAGKGVTFTKVTAPNGKCSISQRVTWTCSFAPDARVAPAKTIGTVTVTFVTSKAAAPVAMGLVTSRIVGSPTRLTHKVPVSAAAPKLPLRIIMRNDKGVTAGGKGTMALRVVNESRTKSATGITATATLPAHVTASRITSGRWSCAPKSTAMTCTYSGTVPAGGHTPQVTMPFSATASAKPRTSQVLWSAGAASPYYASGTTRARLTVHDLVSVAATAVPEIIGSRPAGGKKTKVVLRAVPSTPRDRRVWTTTWTQTCLTDAQRSALSICDRATAQTVPIATPKRAVTTVAIPATKGFRAYVFAATSTDGSARVTRYVKVRAAGSEAISRFPHKRIDARTGLSILTRRATTPAPSLAAPNVNAFSLLSPSRNSARTSAFSFAATATSAATPRATGPTVTISGAPLLTASSGATVTLSSSVSGGTAPYTYSWTETAWTQNAGADIALSSSSVAAPTLVAPSGSSLATYQVKVTDANSLTSIATVTIAFNPSTTTQFCNLYSTVQGASGQVSSVLGGGVNAVFDNLSIVGSVCNNHAGFTFSGSTFTLGGFTFNNVSGTASASGILLSTGSMSPPSSWNVGNMSMGNAGVMIAFVGTGAADVTLAGHFSSSTLFFLPLPGGWSGSTAMNFTATSGDTTIALSANASGPGSANASFSGSVSTNGTFSMSATANDLVKIAGSTIDASGTLMKSTAGGSVTGSLTGSLSGTATLGAGVTIPSLSITWAVGTTPAVSGSGTLAITSNSATTTLNVSMAYTSSSNWTVTVTGGGSSVWQPISGLKIVPSDFSGTVTYTSSGYNWNITADVNTPWSPTSTLTMTSISVEMSNSCPANVSSVLTCPSATFYLGVAADATVDVDPVDSFTASAEAVIGLGTGSSAGGFALAADIDGSVDIADGVSLTSATLTASYNVSQSASGPTVSDTTESGYSIGVTGSMDITGLGDFASAQANITSSGWSIAGYTSGIPFGSSNNYGEMTSSIFAYSTMPTTITPSDSYDIDPLVYSTCTGDVPSVSGAVCVGTFYVSGDYAAPGWFASAIGGTALSATALIELDPTDGTYQADVTMDVSGGAGIAMDSSTSSLTISSLFFDLDATSGNLAVTAGGAIDLDLPSGYGDNPPTLDLFMQYDVDSNTVTGGFTLDDATGWQNAFGDTGLTMYSLTASLQLNLDTMTPALALSGSADLPSNLSGPFQISDNAPVTAFVDLSVDTPCMGVSIGTQGSGEPTVLTIGGGAMTASYVNFYVVPAPEGCTIGTTTYEQGYALDFDGTILGEGVQVDAALTFSPQTTFDATVELSSFQTGPLTMDATTLTIDFAYGVSDDISFESGFELFGTDVTVDGSFDYTDATETTSITLDVQENNFSVSGFSLDNADINLDVTSTGDDTTINFVGSGDMDILGDTLDINELDFTVANNVVTAVTADVSTTLNFNDSIDFAGDFYVNYSASSDVFDMSASVDITSNGFSLGSGTLSISPVCAAVTGTLNMTGMFDASLAGYAVYGSGCTITNAVTDATTSIDANTGGFCVYASIDGISVGGFSGNGSAGLSNNGDTTCTGTSTTPGDVVGSLSVDLTLGTQDVDNNVTVDGTFNSDGTYNFTGSDTLDIAGFDLDMNVAAANDGTTQSVSGSANFDLLGTTVGFSGSFTNVNGSPSTSLSGYVNLYLDGFDAGSSNVYLNQTASSVGMTFDMSLDAGGQTADADITFGEVSGNVLFYVNIDIGLGIPGAASISADGSFSNCSTPSCTSLGSISFWVDNVSFSFGGWGYVNSAAFGIDPSGNFSYSSSGGQSNQSTPTDDVAGVNWWTGNDWWSTSLSVNQDGISASAGGGATIYSQETGTYWCPSSSSSSGGSSGGSSSWFSSWGLRPRSMWSTCSYPVTNWGSTGASASVNPWSFCFQIAGSPWMCL